MLHNTNVSPESYTNDEWSERCEYWNDKAVKSEPRRKRRERCSTPLILNGLGISLRVDKDTLLIQDGITHYPSKNTPIRLFKGSLDLPPRIVLVEGKGSITLDAIDWMAEQGVPLIRLKWDGSFSSIVTSGGQASNTDLIIWQQETRDNPERRLAFALGIIVEKLEAAKETLEHHVPRSRFWQRSFDNISTHIERLQSHPPETLSDLLGIEGAVASDYFRAWRGLEIKWKATKRHPVPDDWHAYLSRSAVRSTVRISNRHATHPVNAMLNYVYSMLLTRTQINLIADGYDPTLGVIHDARRRDRGRTPAYALDMMEPQRPVVDRVILQLIREETFSGADFQLQSNGVCRLNPELARRLVDMGNEKVPA